MLAHDSRTLMRIVDALPVPTFVIDLDHRVTHWNRACEIILGVPASEMVGRKAAWRGLYLDPRPVMADLIVDGDCEALERYYSTTLRASKIVPGAYQAEGYFLKSKRWLSVLASPLTDDQGRVIGAIETLHDITEQKNTAIALLESETLKTSVLSSTAYALIATDPAGIITVFNPGAETLLGYTSGEMVGRHDPRVFHDSDEVREHAGRLSAELGFPITPGFDAFVAKTRTTGTPDEREWTYVRKNGSRIPVLLSVTAIRNAQHDITGYLGVAANIIERKRAEADLRIAATAFESQEGMLITDAAGVIVRVNQAFTNLTGYSSTEAVGARPTLFKSGRHPRAFYQQMWAALKGQGYWQGEIWNRRKCGKIYAEMLTISSVTASDGRITHYVGTFSDISRNSVTEAEIHRLAFYDSLTTLPNRRLFLDRLQQAMAASNRNARMGALLFIDLDNFKLLNDSLGHGKGDLLLEQVAKRLVGAIREGDTVSRLGGDEFVVMLEDLSESAPEAATQARTVGDKIIACLNKPYDLAGVAHHSTPSIGITLFCGQSESIDDLMKRADFAMYQAKSAGRNTLRFYDSDMQASATARAMLADDLCEAVRQQQFVLYYQIQVGACGRPAGAEALVRWQHPVRGIVSPIDFIPLAEETGTILPLGHWVLKTACLQLAAWATQPEFAGLTLAVNVSARQIRQPDFVKQVLAVLAETGGRADRLKLELTESMLLDDVEDIIGKMSDLKACGIGFALDDFGTGYSSLLYLKRLPLDELKIDKSFVRDVLVDANDSAIVRTIVALAQNLGLAVIAEGVETKEQRDFLANAGCLAWQGYFFGHPLPLQEFERLLRGSNDKTLA
ncbi:MAG: EAL domain-containing protein [Burkholderiaceae bacterium]|nr:EAL domain-containing protein [Burkholderiaceae bacterium]